LCVEHKFSFLSQYYLFDVGRSILTDILQGLGIAIIKDEGSHINHEAQRLLNNTFDLSQKYFVVERYAGNGYFAADFSIF
jgi:F0F1-type ATP synthase beta subunit